MENKFIGQLIKAPASIYWRTIRKLMPPVTAKWAGVNSAFDRKIFDTSLLPSWFNFQRDLPNYESALCQTLTENVLPGDKVTIVGGGFGITAILASQRTGPNGQVLVYEGSSKQISQAKKAVLRNNCPAPITFENAIIGEPISIWEDENGSAKVISPTDLQPCDVLEMDCEGSEVGILKTMRIRPRVIAVETHGCYGAPTENVKSILESLGYQVEDLGIAELDHADSCVTNDIRVLTATREIDGK